jgi:hypothetical protein
MPHVREYSNPERQVKYHELVKTSTTIRTPKRTTHRHRRSSNSPQRSQSPGPKKGIPRKRNREEQTEPDSPTDITHENTVWKKPRHHDLPAENTLNRHKRKRYRILDSEGEDSTTPGKITVSKRKRKKFIIPDSDEDDSETE